MISKICLVLCFLAYEVGVASAYCPTTTREMAKSCITEDRKCSATPRMVNGCFNGCDITCSDSEDENRCANPTDLDMCDDLNDPYCSSIADMETVNGKQCFSRCVMMCSKK
ncbi:uncharacterized protein LOC125650027 [Ostrea edulis]|uniref:uncharacterized protein LOC125650027 n=1 Tax=Ostrea edulis TaxID=37623 RepID=UPI00209655B1|nr:uncharacterized protein LOC125650027 [Ostrea edulis]